MIKWATQRGQEEVSRPFWLCDFITQPIQVVLRGSAQEEQRKPAQPGSSLATAQQAAAFSFQQSPGERATRFEKKIKKADIWQFLRFCVVGSLNAVIDFAVLNVLLWLYPTENTWQVLGYNSLAVLLAATNSFFWNKYWTFKQRGPITFQEVFRFVVLSSGTILMNDLLMWLLSSLFPGLLHSTLIGANALKLGAIIGTMSISFFGMRLWVFFQRKHIRTAETKVFADSGPVSTDSISNLFTNMSRTQQGMKTLIIIPTYNESENLLLLLKQIFWYAPAADVLIIDDNSPDGTGALADEIGKQDTRVHILHRPGKLGLGTAYIAGFKYAIQQGYDAAFEMDADFSHDPRYLPDFLKAVEQADLVIGSRYIPGGSTPNWSFIRRLISGSGNIFARFMLSIPVHDCTSGFRCYRRSVLESIDLDAVQSRGYAFQVELTHRVLKQGFKIVETPITFMDRRLGTSKMSRKIVIEAFTYVLRTRFSKQSSVRVAALQRAGHLPVTSNQDPRTEALPSVVIQTMAGFASPPLYATTNQWNQQGISSPTGSSSNVVAQQQLDPGGHQFRLPTDFWDVQAVRTYSGVQSQGLPPQSMPMTSSDSILAPPLSQQPRPGYSMNSVWLMEPFSVLPSLGQSANGEGRQGFGKQTTRTIGNTSQQERRGILHVAVGKEPGRTYAVCKESLSIGRIRESDIVLDDPAISRLHASLVSEGDGNYVLIDEGSANGTKVNGQEVEKYQRYPVHDGDKIQLGETMLVFARHYSGW